MQSGFDRDVPHDNRSLTVQLRKPAAMMIAQKRRKGLPNEHPVEVQ